ncbi:DUF6684 family protein [Natrarchaeobius sp. A-rgal3]|uniref:DUF6684 family protein n=1 Tax=Natrarchaeobius versutus TaxID=1679078 RepID=UPI00350FAFB9
MVSLGLSRESLRDISGNLVPLVILAFFGLWFALEAPWGWPPLSIVLVYGLVISLGAVLFGVTYVTALAFDAADAERE